VPSDIHFFFFCDLTDPIVSLATSSRTVLVPFQSSIAGNKYQNQFMHVKVTATQRWDIFLRHDV